MKKWGKVKNPESIINPTMRFKRIAIATEDKKLKEFLCYELAPYPLSIVDNEIMRKTQTSKLYDFLVHLPEKYSLENYCHVIDGEFLLHRVV